jgi:hypothetical protein
MPLNWTRISRDEARKRFPKAFLKTDSNNS